MGGVHHPWCVDLETVRRLVEHDLGTCCMWTVNKKRHSGGLRDALECGVALARTLPEMPNSVRFAFPGPLVDRLYVGELKRDVS